MTRRILILHTGGTFGMQRTPSGYQPRSGLADLLAGILPGPGVGRMPAWELREYERLIDSAEAQPRDWHTIASDIAARYDAFDGFVVIHGTDTMAYAAATLSFALCGLRKPVIVTGAQVPLCEAGSDARDNLLAALVIAAYHPVAEVCLYFNGKLLRGNRSTKVSSVDFDAFDSPNYPPLGRVLIDPARRGQPRADARTESRRAAEDPGSPASAQIRGKAVGGGIDALRVAIDRHRVLRVPAQENFAAPAAVTPEIAVLRVHPGLSVARIGRMLEPAIDGVVLQTYGAGNGPVALPGFLDVLAAASARGVVIVNVSQCLHGGIDQGRYATGSALAAAGVIGGLDMTVEAALAKLDHLLAIGLDPDAVRGRMQQALCGECTQPTDAPTGP